MKQKKRNKSDGISFTFTDYLYLIGLLIGLSYVVYLIGFHAISNIYLDLHKGKNVKIKAVVINETNNKSSSPNSPDQEFTYSYMFIVNGKIYKGDTYDEKHLNEKLKVGDSLWIEYVPEHPSFTRPLNKNK